MVRIMVNLTNVFYSLIDEGFIYDEDENGLSLSYGECVAIAEHFHNIVDNYIREQLNPVTSKSDFEDAINNIRCMLDTADDDTKMFGNLDEYDDIYCYYDEDEDTLDLEGPSIVIEYLDNVA